MSDIYEAALDSCRFNSMSPERMARTLADDYDRHLAEVQDQFAEFAGIAGPERARAEFEMYHDGYDSRFRAWLAARGRTASAMVTGPSNFPAARNRKRMDTERRRSEELTEWSKRARKQALKRLTPEPDYAAELEKLEELHATMKEANKIVRKKWPDDRKVAALVADLGLKESTAREILEPDFCGRGGFPSHKLSSLRGKIKRLRPNVEQAA